MALQTRDVTAKVVVTNKGTPYDGQVSVSFSADYQDGRNKEWSKYTPALTIGMTVKEEIADEHFPTGQSFLLTFTPEDGQP